MNMVKSILSLVLLACFGPAVLFSSVAQQKKRKHSINYKF